MTELTFARPDEAEAAYYAAFTHRNIEAMMAVWADDDHIACIHPVGHRIEGRAAIRRSWTRIFEHSPPVAFRLSGAQHFDEERLAVHVVNEHIRVGDEENPPVLVTNVYKLTAAGWRMILHHASPPPPSAKRPADSPLH